MQFIQKKLSNTHRFDFQPETLKFHYKDRSGSGEVEIAYGDVALKPSVRIEDNAWWRNLGYLWIVLGCLQLGWALFAGDPLAGRGFWVLAGCVSLGVYRFTRVRYSVFAASGANLFVIQGEKQHDPIVRELMERRREQLRRWYGTVNPNGEPDKEISRFHWLVDQQALTQQEADMLIAEVEAAGRSLAVPSGSGLPLH